MSLPPFCVLVLNQISVEKLGPTGANGLDTRLVLVELLLVVPVPLPAKADADDPFSLRAPGVMVETPEPYRGWFEPAQSSVTPPSRHSRPAPSCKASPAYADGSPLAIVTLTGRLVTVLPAASLARTV